MNTITKYILGLFILFLSILYMYPYVNNKGTTTYSGCTSIGTIYMELGLMYMRNLGYKSPNHVFCNMGSYLHKYNENLGNAKPSDFAGLYISGTDGVYVNDRLNHTHYLIFHEAFHYNQYLRFNDFTKLSSMVHLPFENYIVKETNNPEASNVLEFQADYFAKCKIMKLGCNNKLNLLYTLYGGF